MRKNLPLLLFVLLALFGGAAVVMLHSGEVSSGYSENDRSYNKEYWKKEIDQQGAVKAYALFKERNAVASSARQHFGAHIFGELLYETQGPGGVAICDASFGFGCFHGFFGRAVTEGGEKSIALLDAKCLSAFGSLGTGCQHGLGHGILEYVGYDHIDNALELCKQTTQKVPLLGCTSGVFMEYNTPLAKASTTVQISTRRFDASAPYQPCTTVNAAYQASCYFELGGWFLSTFGAGSPELVKLCSGLPNTSRAYCFLGMGATLAPLENYDEASVLAHCDEYQHADARACRAGVAWAFWSNPVRRAEASKACVFSDVSDAATCKKLADLTEGLDPTFSL